MNVLIPFIALIFLLIMVFIGIHFLNGGIALMNNRKWKLTKHTRPLDVEGGIAKLLGICFIIISFAFFICTIPIVYYMSPYLK